MEVIINDKTLSIKHYLNKNLKPVIDKENGRKQFPLYTQVVYETKSTKFKAFTNTNPNPNLSTSDFDTWICYEECDEDIRNGKMDCLPKEIIEADKQIAEIIEYEISKQKNNFNLKGLGNRLEVYWTSVDIILSEALYDSVLFYLGSKLLHNEFEEIVYPYEKNKQLDKIMEEVSIIKPEIIEEMPEIIKNWFSLFLGLVWFNVEHQKRFTCYQWLIKGANRHFASVVEEIFKQHDLPLTSKEMSEQTTDAIDIWINQQLGY